MPPERLSELFDALIRPSFLCEIERSDGEVEHFDPVTLFSSLIESEIDLANATKLFDEIVAVIHGLQTDGSPLRLTHSNVHDIVASAILQYVHPHAPFWLSNYEGMFARDVDTEDDQSPFIDARNASVLRSEIKYFLEGKRGNVHADNASLRDITNRIIKLIRFCGFYKLRRDFLHLFLDELSNSSAKAFIPDIAISAQAFSEQLDSVERMLLAVPSLPPQQHINFCSATLAMLSSAILGWLGVIHASSHQDSLRHVKTIVEDFYRDRQRRAEVPGTNSSQPADIASLLALRGRLDAWFSRADLQPKEITDAIDAIIEALDKKHVSEVIFFTERIVRYFRILSAESEFPRALSQFRFGDDSAAYIEAIASHLAADGVEISSTGSDFVELRVNSRFHKIVEYGDRLRIIVVNAATPQDVDSFDFSFLEAQTESDRALIFALVLQNHIRGLFLSNLRATIERTRRFITVIRRDELERCVVRGEDLRTLAHRSFFHIFPEGAEWQETEIFKFDEPQLPLGLRPRESELLKSALGAIEKGPETTPTLQVLRLLESRIREHAFLIYALALKLNCAAVIREYPAEQDFNFAHSVKFLRELSRIDARHLPKRVQEVLPTPALLREVDQLREFRNVIAHNDLTIDHLKAKDAMHRAAVAMAQLNAISKGYIKVASDSDGAKSYLFTSAGDLQTENTVYWADTATSGHRRVKLRWRFGYLDPHEPKFNFLAQARCTVSGCGKATRMMMGAVSNRYFCEACDDNPQAEGDWERLILKLKPTLANEDQSRRVNTGVAKPLVGSSKANRTLSLPAKQDPVKLDEAEYQEILSIIQNMSLVMERSPDSFRTMGEEDIRHHFLVQLNGQYKGAATGETFNGEGKTDILIRSEGRNAFIAECKFWRGEKTFLETIDQILSYLGWRDTKAAIIIFNRTKQFTPVLEKIRDALTRHPNKVGDVTVESETRFRCLFRQPSDNDREVTLTVMAFAVPN
jgi:hypothetical protein